MPLLQPTKSPRSFIILGWVVIALSALPLSDGAFLTASPLDNEAAFGFGGIALIIFAARAYGDELPFGWCFAAASFVAISLLVHFDRDLLYAPLKVPLFGCLLLSSVLRIWIGLQSQPIDGAAWLTASGMFGLVDTAVILWLNSTELPISNVFLIGLDMVVFGVAVILFGISTVSKDRL
ncbi:hypothetical protein G6M50_16740 [Agrobacterium rhizogenes]|nr:hypothetical protein [Rhizobium rhizogenes]NTJ79427.1 hypothetical protein [Rhizobium rhizogenes]